MRVKKWILDYPELTFTIQSRSGSIVASLALNNDVGNDVGNELSDVQKKILYIIKENRNHTIVELAQLIGSTSRTIERNIAQLKEMNILKRKGSRKDGHWKIE